MNKKIIILIILGITFISIGSYIVYEFSMLDNDEKYLYKISIGKNDFNISSISYEKEIIIEKYILKVNPYMYQECIFTCLNKCWDMKEDGNDYGLTFEEMPCQTFCSDFECRTVGMYKEDHNEIIKFDILKYDNIIWKVGFPSIIKTDLEYSKYDKVVLSIYDYMDDSYYHIYELVKKDDKYYIPIQRISTGVAQVNNVVWLYPIKGVELIN